MNFIPPIATLSFLAITTMGFSQSSDSAEGYAWANSMLDLRDHDNIASFTSEASGRSFYYMYAERDSNGFVLRAKWIDHDSSLMSIAGDSSLSEHLGPIHFSDEFMTIREHLFNDSTVFFSGDPGASTYHRCDVAVLKVDDVLIAGYSFGKVDAPTALLAILKRYLICSADDLGKLDAIMRTRSR